MASPAYRLGDRSGRASHLQKSLRFGIATSLAVLTLPFVGVTASAAPVNGIEIDGNRAGPNDWEDLTAADSRYARVLDPDPAEGLAEDDIFQDGSKENKPPSGWLTGVGSTETGGDVVEVFAYHEIEPNNGDVEFYFGFLREADGVGAFV